jgi:PAS domain S-box-containing protein
VSQPGNHHQIGEDSRPRPLRYGVALLSVGVGFAARMALTPVIGPTALPFIFFFPAVAIAAWVGGTGPGVLSIGCATLLASWFVLGPLHSFSAGSYGSLTIAAFVVASSLIVAAMHAMHRARAHLVAEIGERRKVERELAQSRDLFATTLASIGDGVITTDADGRITFLNAEAERLTGWRKYEALRQHLRDVFRIVNEATRQTVESPVDKVIRVGAPVGMANHTLLISRDGSETPIDDSAAPIRDAGGPLFGVVLVFRDVSDQRRASVATSHLAAIIENSPDAIISTTMTGIVQSWNPAAQRIFGYEAAEILGRPLSLIVPIERRPEEQQILDRLRQGAPSVRLQTERLTKGGSIIKVSFTAAPILDRDGKLIGASKIILQLG